MESFSSVTYSVKQIPYALQGVPVPSSDHKYIMLSYYQRMWDHLEANQFELTSIHSATLQSYKSTEKMSLWPLLVQLLWHPHNHLKIWASLHLQLPPYSHAPSWPTLCLHLPSLCWAHHPGHKQESSCYWLTKSTEFGIYICCLS